LIRQILCSVLLLCLQRNGETKEKVLNILALFAIEGEGGEEIALLFGFTSYFGIYGEIEKFGSFDIVHFSVL